MCGPMILAAIPLAISATQMIAKNSGLDTSGASAKAAANQTYAQQTNIIAQKAVQIDAQHSEDVFDNAIKAQADQSSIAASASDSGLGPSSLIHALNASDFADSRQATIQDINTQDARQQLGNELQADNVNRNAKINAIGPTGFKPLSLVDPLMGAALGGKI